MAPWVVAHVARQLRQEINWDWLIREAHRQSVLPLLRHNLHRHFWPQTPPDVRDYLTQACQHAQRRNLALTAELLRVLAHLQEAGVPAIPFKGPVLGLAAYSNAALRTFGDLDILVHEDDLGTASRLLAAQGYIPKFTFTPQQERAYRKAECALQFRHPGRDVVIELHWLLTERYLSIDLPMASFWKRSVSATLAGRSVIVFAAEDLFLYLCVHGCKHEWERLEWLSSVAAIIEAHPDLDWDAVYRRARKCGIHRLVKVTLLLANHLLQVAVPPPYRNDAGADHGTDALFREILAKLFVSDSKEHDSHKRGSWYLFLLRTRERWSDKARIIVFSSLRLPHPSAERYLPLPPQLSFLHYVVRPVRLLSAAVALTWHYWTTERKRLAAAPAASDPAAETARESAGAHILIH